MQLAEYFTVFLRDTVNLSQPKLDRLSGRVDAIYAALREDDEIGSMILGKNPQGSWAQKTIINPVGSKEFDADFMLNMSENADWTSSPKQYIDAVYRALHRSPTYGGMPHSRKCRCVQVVYSNSMHVDIVPHLELADGREVIVNRDEDMFEKTHPQGFTEWMKEKDGLSNGNLRKVIRLMKYLRDHKNSFTGTRSVLLTTLLGEQVKQVNALIDPAYYGNVPQTLLRVVEDLDAWLQERPIKPSIFDPSGSGANFDHRWTQETYAYFRDRIHVHARQIREAFDEEDKDRSVELWRVLFGEAFKPPEPPKSTRKFSTPAAPVVAPSTIGRSGRAG
jgi:hypothetical protein